MSLYLLWYIPLVILQMWMFQNVNCEIRHPTFGYHFDKSLNIRSKKETSGYLQANSIQTERMATNKLFSKDVTADIVKANKVKSVIISLGKAFSFQKGRRKGDNRDTFILNRDGVDSTDASVTIFLKRDNNESVSINGYSSDKTKQKQYSSRKIPFVRKLMNKAEYFSNPVSIQNPMYNTKTKPTMGSPLQHIYSQKHQSSKLNRKARQIPPTSSRPIGSSSEQIEKVSTLQTNNNMKQNWRKKNFMFANHQESQNSAVQGIAGNIYGNSISTFVRNPFQNKGLVQHQLFKVESTPIPTRRFLRAHKQTEEFYDSDVSFSSETDDIPNAGNTVTTHNEFSIQETAKIVKGKDTNVSVGKSFPILDANWYTDNSEMHISNRNGAIPTTTSVSRALIGRNDKYSNIINYNTAGNMNLWNRENVFVRKRLSSQTNMNNYDKTYIVRPMLDTLSQTKIINEIKRIKRLHQNGLHKYKVKQHVIQQDSSQEDDSFDWESDEEYSFPSKTFKQAKRRNYYDSIYGKFSTSEENVIQKESKRGFKQTAGLTSNNVNDKRKLYIANKHSFIRKKDDLFFI
ncbi:uncharacterized protein LOC127720218 [Mytilus californianus]|uniref:uncharacterized protein LOC127720218 n=1 Tax=Mytilus californianus TaxID=6549 RepID=UPI0022450560|nr:uncharacterized protein LOC127720218 [Mytilus californianus]